MTRGAQQQSKQAFIELHQALGQRLLAYLFRRVHDSETAAELWAECWAQAFENWYRCRATTRAEAEGWVFGIARNQLIAYYRAGAIKLRAVERLRWTLPAVDGALDEELEAIVDRDALRRAFADALETLPPMRSQAVRLRVIDGLAYREVAQRLGCSEQAARAHVSRGLKRLADAIDRYELRAETETLS
jgi:RNA polymerase sigma factor (sigma-70 family)